MPYCPKFYQKFSAIFPENQFSSIFQYSVQQSPKIYQHIELKKYQYMEGIQVSSINTGSIFIDWNENKYFTSGISHK
jgi:hypothetical protein